MSQSQSSSTATTSSLLSSPSTAARIAALRAEVELELQNKKQCAYKPYECTKLALDNFNYCNRHILEDKSAPFKQCTYIYVNSGKRCYLPALKGDKKDTSCFCNEHALKAHMTRTKQASRYPAPLTPEVLLHSLSHYIKKPRIRTTSNSTQSSDDCGRVTPEDLDTKVTKHLDPFTDINVKQVNQSCSDILDMCSESESDVEPSTYSSVWQDAQADTSDNESIDSEQEDLLKHANVYTAEEITQVNREKLIRLQALYIDQYRYLQYLLKEKRRKYLYNLKREKDTYCSIQNQVKDNPKEFRLYKKLKAYSRYHKKNGTEAILSKRVNDLRMKITDGLTARSVPYVKCSYTEGGVKCGEKALPAARYCRRHILEDPNQVLFRACGKIKADIECKTPVEGIFDDTTCPLHMDMPPIRSYSQTRKDSESDYDDATMDNNSLCNVLRESGNKTTKKNALSNGKEVKIEKKEVVKLKVEDSFDVIDKQMEEIYRDDDAPIVENGNRT